MKSLKLNWDLKKNKAMKYTTSAEVFKEVSGKANITNYKVKSAGKGYKQLSFNVTFRDDKIKISNAQWKKLRNMNRVLRDGVYWYSVADYDTGLSLESKNKFGVKVRSSRWEACFLLFRYYLPRSEVHFHCSGNLSPRSDITPLCFLEKLPLFWLLWSCSDVF